MTTLCYTPMFTHHKVNVGLVFQSFKLPLVADTLILPPRISSLYPLILFLLNGFHHSHQFRMCSCNKVSVENKSKLHAASTLSNHKSFFIQFRHLLLIHSGRKFMLVPLLYNFLLPILEINVLVS